MKKYSVYILQCRDGSYYTGVTNDADKRLYEHQYGLIPGCYTHGRRPVKLVAVEVFDKVLDAIKREKQVKGWSRKKKQALIKNDYGALPELSRSRKSRSFILRQAQDDGG